MRTFINTIMTSVFAVVNGRAVVVAVNDKRDDKRRSLRLKAHRYLSMCMANAMYRLDSFVDAIQTLSGQTLRAAVLVNGTGGSEPTGSDRWLKQMHQHLNHKPVINRCWIISPVLGTVARS